MLPLILALQALPGLPGVTDPPARAPADIVVTGRGLTPMPGDRVYDTVTIGRDRLATVPSGRLEDVLRDAAGFQQFRRSDARSAHPTSQGATLRGLGGNASSRALVLLDGVPQVDPFGGWVSFSAFDPIRLGEVRVTRGGGSGVAGPGALAGTIELSSAGPGDASGLAGGIAYGSRDAIDADASVAGALGSGYGSIAAGYQRGDGFVPIVRAARGPADVPARYEQASVAMRALFPVAEAVELQASGLALYDDRSRGIAFTDNRNLGADANLRLVGRGRWGFEALGYVQLRGFESGFASVDDARTRASAVLDQYNVPATGLGGRIELRPPTGGGVTLRVGADARATDGRTKEFYTFVGGAPTRRREAGGRTTTVGAFADASWEATPALTLTGGARVDRWRIEDGFLFEQTLATGATLTDAAIADRRGTETTARGGIAYRLSDAVSVRGAAYLGWRLPTLNELYRPFRAGPDATAANPALSPERLEGVDLELDLTPARGVQIAATLFHNRLEDAIANVTLGTGPGTFPGVGFVAPGGAYRQRQNLSAVRSRGAELDASLARGAWSLAASYAYIDARVRADGPAGPLDGRRPAQTAPHQASATLGWGAERARAALTARYVARQFEDDQNDLSLDDALTFDAYAAWPLGRRLTLEARAENLADARVEATASGAGLIERATPRTIWIGLRYAR